MVAARGTATACPSEVAREVGGATWRTLMPTVRAAAGRLQERGLIDVYQHGRPVELATARGPIRLRTRQVETDHRAHPERYAVGRGEEGVLTVEPYKRELLPLWRFRTPAVARTSAAALYRAFVAYGKAADFVGMDMARKFIQMGWTRARRYANHRSGRKYGEGRVELPDAPDPVKAESAEIFRRYLERTRKNRTYARLRLAHVALREAVPTTAAPTGPASGRPRPAAGRRARGRPRSAI